MGALNDQDVILTADMIERIQAAVMAVATGGGWGEVCVVIEKGQPKRIQQTRDEWLVKHTH